MNPPTKCKICEREICNKDNQDGAFDHVLDCITKCHGNHIPDFGHSKPCFVCGGTRELTCDGVKAECSTCRNDHFVDATEMVPEPSEEWWEKEFIQKFCTTMDDHEDHPCRKCAQMIEFIKLRAFESERRGEEVAREELYLAMSIIDVDKAVIRKVREMVTPVAAAREAGGGKP